MSKKKNNIAVLKKKIRNKEVIVGVIGLGYVGLPLALTFAKKGFTVIGIDIDKARITRIKKNASYITDVSDEELREASQGGRFTATTNSAAIQKVDAVIICVPTPLGKDRQPDISYIREAVTKVKENIRAGQVIVLESTTYPGTTREILLPILESTGLREGKDFYLAFSPERIDPGNKIYNTESTPKIIGGISRTSTRIAELLYSEIIRTVVSVSSASAAEMVKLLENTFRIVNIALVNEITTLCDTLGLDIWEIIDAAKTKPYGYMPFYPGPGVGGHCIPVDPLYLSWKAREHGFETRFIDLASSVNESMPQYVIDKLERIMAGKGKRLERCKVLVVGVAYKKDVKDLRESPAIDILRILKARNVETSYHDPLFPFLKISGIDLKRSPFSQRILKSRDCVIIAAAHSTIDYALMVKHSKVILDTRGVLRMLTQSMNKKLKSKVYNL